MTGPSQLIPDNSNFFQKLSSKQIPRSLFPEQKEFVDSDMVSHMCLAIPAELFKKVGWENPDIISGTDPDLRYRVRQAGYRVGVVPECIAYHPMPDSLQKLLKLAFIKGSNSAIVRNQYPELVFELDTGYNKEFSARKPFAFRILRHLWLTIFSLLSFKIIYFLYNLFYIAGYIRGTFLKGVK